jgi:hypothetical protein
MLTEEDVAEAEHALNTIGKFVKAYPVEAVNKHGELCAIISTEVYMRKLTSNQKQPGTNF